MSPATVLAAWSEWHDAGEQPGYHSTLLAFPTRADAVRWIRDRARHRQFAWGERLLEPQVVFLNGKDVGWYMCRTA